MEVDLYDNTVDLYDNTAKNQVSTIHMLTILLSSMVLSWNVIDLCKL